MINNNDLDLNNLKYKLLGKGIMNTKISVKDGVFVSLSYSLVNSEFMSVGTKEVPQGAILFKANTIEDLYTFDNNNNVKECRSNEDVQDLINIASSLNPNHIIYVYDEGNNKVVDWQPRFIIDINTYDYNYKMDYLYPIYSRDYIKVEQIKGD